MSEWQPIETAPKDGTDILASWFAPRKPWRAIGVLRWHADEWLTRPGDWGMKPTHWMSLPPQPQDSVPACK